MGIFKFLFYVIYLLAAELPVFLILFLRSWNEESIHTNIKYLTIGSISINILLCLLTFSYIWKRTSTMKSTITNITPNNSNISDFFSFFLLPFFTFSFSSNLDSIRFFIELAILFILLSLLLLKTKNLSSNIIYYVLFNNFNVETKSNNNMQFLVLKGLNFEDFEEGKSLTIKVTKDFYIYYGSKKKLIINISIVLTILVLLLLAVLFSNNFL